MTDDLDTLLRAPLPEIPDKGFSAMTMVRIEAMKSRESAWSMAAICLSVLVSLPFLPVDAIVRSLMPTLTAIAFQPGVYIAGAAIALTLIVDRELAQG